MARVSKDKWERRQELIDTAMQLFLEKGYDNTAVSHIVKKMNVAQGTFYYHFSSKAEILKAVAQRYNGELERNLQLIVRQGTLDPAEKLNEVVNEFLRLMRLPEKGRTLVDIVHTHQNIVLHEELMRMLVDTLVPVIEEILSEGVTLNRFQLPHPAESAEIVVGSLTHMAHRLYGLKSQKEKERLLLSMEHALEKMVALEDYAFTFKA